MKTLAESFNARLTKLLEAQQRRVVGFLPGRFQPFHKGHKEVYNELVRMCGADSTFILTSDKTASYKSPLSFDDKKVIMTRMCDIPEANIVLTASPYSIPTDQNFDEYNTVAVFAVSSKDMQEDPRFSFPESGQATRQDGQPKYLQKYPGSVEQCEPMATHAYVMEVDVHTFTIAGRNATSATEIRELLVSDEDTAKRAFEDLYGRFDQEVFDMIRSRIENKVLTVESTNPDLEQFRLDSIAELNANVKEIIAIAADVTGMTVVGFKIVGSVLDPNKFNEESDVDGMVFVRIGDEPEGILENETEAVQAAMVHRFFSFGVLNIGVYNLKDRSTKGLLTEGGQVWKAEAATQRINKADVAPTVKWLEKITGLDLMNNLLGSTGRKDTSGDIDVGVTGDMQREMLAQKLTDWATQNDPLAMVAKTGSSVHFRTPIRGNGKNGYVQTDFMFLPDIEFSKWAMAAHQSKYTAADKAIVLSSIAKTMGLKFSNQTGLSSRKTNSSLPNGKDPTYIAQTLLGSRATPDDLNTIESILKALRNDPQANEKLADAREALGKKGITI